MSHTYGRTASCKDVFQLVESIEKAYSEANFSAVLRLANLAININKLDESSPLSQRAQLYRWRCEARLALDEEMEEALEDANQAVGLEPTAEAYGLLGRVHRALGHSDEARQAEEQAKKLTNKAQLETMLHAVDDLLAQGKFVHSYKMATNGARVCGTTHCLELRPSFHLRVVKSLVALGRFVEAEEQGQHALTDAIMRKDVRAIEQLEKLLAQARAATQDTPASRVGPNPPSVVESSRGAPLDSQPSDAAERDSHHESQPMTPTAGTSGRAPPSAWASPVLEPQSPRKHEAEQHRAVSSPKMQANTKELRIGRSLSGSGVGVPTGVIVTIAIVAMGALIGVGLISLFMMCQADRESESSVAKCMYDSLKEVKDFIDLFAVPLQLWTVILTGVVTAVSWLRYRGPGS